MDGRLEAIVGGVAGLGASLAVAVPDGETIEAVGRWPLTVVLGAVCCFCVWIIYRQGCKFGERLDKHIEQTDRFHREVDGRIRRIEDKVGASKGRFE